MDEASARKIVAAVVEALGLSGARPKYVRVVDPNSSTVSTLLALETPGGMRVDVKVREGPGEPGIATVTWGRVGDSRIWSVHAVADSPGLDRLAAAVRRALELYFATAMRLGDVGPPYTLADYRQDCDVLTLFTEAYGPGVAAWIHVVERDGSLIPYLSVGLRAEAAAADVARSASAVSIPASEATLPRLVAAGAANAINAESPGLAVVDGDSLTVGGARARLREDGGAVRVELSAGGVRMRGDMRHLTLFISRVLERVRRPVDAVGGGLPGTTAAAES